MIKSAFFSNGLKRIAIIVAMLGLQNFSAHLNAQGGTPNPVGGETLDIEFLGMDYDGIGYSLNPGESLELLFRNNTAEEAYFPVEWVLRTYIGKDLTKGSSQLKIKAGETGRVPISIPDDLQDGPYNVYYSPKTEGWQGSHPFYFDYRKAEDKSDLNMNLVAFIENMDAEGWGRMMTGPLSRNINVWHDFPKDLSSVDAAIVVGETMDFYANDFERLAEYVRMGGTILVFGKTSSVLNMILPVTGSDLKPEKSSPLTLEPLDGGPWYQFNVDESIKHYPMKVQAKEGARVIAEWSDGSPAVVTGMYGQGTIIYVGTGTYQVWQKNESLQGADELALRLLYDAKGGTEAVINMLAYAQDLYTRELQKNLEIRDKVLEGIKIKKPDEFTVISENNFGRFGWLVDEGGLTENMDENGRVSTVGTQDWQLRGGSPMRTDPRFTFSLSVSGNNRPLSTNVQQNWFAKEIEWTYAHDEKISSTLSLGSPAILWEGKAENISLNGSNFTHIAYPAKEGMNVVERGESIDPRAMSENWILTFIADPDLRDMPQLIVLTNRPKKMEFKEGLAFEFDSDGFVAMFTSRLYGIKRLAPGESLKWIDEIPEGTIEDARRWSKVVLHYPVECDEIGWIENDIVKVADRIGYKEFDTDWKTKGQTMTMIPPVYTLALETGAPIMLPDNLVDMNCPTKFGYLKALKGSSSIISISVPPLDHRAIVPAEGQMPLKDKINSNLEGLALNTDTYADKNIRNTGPGKFNDDLLPYDISRFMPYNEAPQIDLYKWWYVFNAILARPVYYDSVRTAIDRHYTTRYWETLNFYPHKSLVMQKREPFTGTEYMATFVWPTQSQYGFRHFNDINEASGVNVYCYSSYARYYGDWTTLKANWNLCRELHNYLTETQDWAVMSSAALDYWVVSGLDMLNSEPYGSLTFAYAAEHTGNKQDALEGKVFGTRSMVPTVARLGLEKYLVDISSEGDPWRDFLGHFHFNEKGMQLSRNKMGGVSWLNTSKGIMHELALGYKVWAPVNMNKEQRAMESSGTRGGADLMMAVFLGWDKDSLLSKATALDAPFGGRSRGPRWQDAQNVYDLSVLCLADIPVFLSDWAPAEYISGKYLPDKKEMELLFQSHLGQDYMVKLYSQYMIEEVRINDKIVDGGWKYNPEDGWMMINLTGEEVNKVKIQFGKEVAPLHPYFTRVE